MAYNIPLLPLGFDIETKAILKKTASARSALAEMKGAAASIPNTSILINTLSLQEAKDSSAIENIITTHDELYQSDAFEKNFKSTAAKEVHSYAQALRNGFDIVKKDGFISNKHILHIQSLIESNEAGFRKLPGTALKNDQTGEVVYTPPQSYDEIVALMDNLEKFINYNELTDWDPLVKMAIIHHQFESIHPFYDGNGRTGRIINILYLVKEELVNIPILYLSRYINRNKATYYQLLQKVRTDNAWEEWILFNLEAIEQTSKQTIVVISEIKKLMFKHKQKMRTAFPNIYSQDLLNIIFRHPYSKIEFVMKELGVTRITATGYLDKLTSIDILNMQKIGRENYYINTELYELLGSINHGK